MFSLSSAPGDAFIQRLFEINTNIGEINNSHIGQAFEANTGFIIWRIWTLKVE